MEYFEKASLFYKNGNYEKAVSFYDKYIDVEESTFNRASGYYNIGVCYIKLLRFNDALRFFRNALKLRQESKYFYNIGYCYFKLNDYKKASQYFKTAYSLACDDPECKHALTVLEKRLKIKQK